MLYCEKCGVQIHGNRSYCPLCGKKIADVETEEFGVYPTIPTRMYYDLIFRISTFAAIAAILVINIINLAFIPHLALYIPLTLSVICAWIIINVGYRKRRNIPKNILYEAIISFILCLIWDKITGWRFWSINYVLPITTASLNVFYFVMSIVDRRNASAYGIYFMSSLVGTVITAVLFFAGISAARPFSAICISIGVLLLCFQVLFRWHIFSSELSSRFHM
ncbi:MAG: hypothetical protein IJ325_11040 [Clostridia bacterium]|nr:hypothetical protein [Clostridia bacterium]